jgi:hypothetical protein
MRTDHEGERRLHLLAPTLGAQVAVVCRYMPWNFTSC